MGKQLARPPGAPRPLCVCFTVGTCTHPSCNVIAILRAIGAQVSSCMDPTDARGAILCGYSRFCSVSYSGCICVYFGNFTNLDPFRTVGVAHLMG